MKVDKEVLYGKKSEGNEEEEIGGQEQSEAVIKRGQGKDKANSGLKKILHLEECYLPFTSWFLNDHLRTANGTPVMFSSVAKV